MDYLPYGRHTIEPDDLEAVEAALRSGWLTQGPRVDKFEQEAAEFFGVPEAIAVSSGTAALHLACLALKVEAGQKVLTTPNTFVASANCFVYCGARPVFADINGVDYQLDAERARETLAADAKQEIRGLVGVDFAGLPADWEKLSGLAKERGLWTIQDACHAPAAHWKDSTGKNHRVGDASHADVVVMSLHPVKHFTAGEGGLVLTKRPEIAARVRSLRTHGIEKDPSRLLQPSPGDWYYEMQELGFNYRITDFQCALASSQLPKLKKWIEKRREIAAFYRQALDEVAEVVLPAEPPGRQHVYHLFVVLVPNRDEVFRKLRAAGIGVQVHYIPVHTQPYYQRVFGTKWGDFPRAEDYSKRALSLPIFPGMTEADVRRVVDNLKSALVK
ncbi:MAG: UDP-4-amino-4,6-dideoxy-N-acetyl-beta-L-altrosamine transaminase [Verrucomicrobiae bacterium]|nr:UDP-4-amino-4,6-dideoxy-N-acetyl-beta-L-altrosamine transaminase [Verrucomicrobiae bacterium]